MPLVKSLDASGGCYVVPLTSQGHPECQRGGIYRCKVTAATAGAQTSGQHRHGLNHDKGDGKTWDHMRDPPARALKTGSQVTCLAPFLMPCKALEGTEVIASWWYCWWKKSCTSWYGKYPIIYRVLYMPGGCLGFLPSTVCIEVWGFTGEQMFEEYNPHWKMLHVMKQLGTDSPPCFNVKKNMGGEHRWTSLPEI